ncbi:uncharacterized protein VTP21DRAFT_9885 [Calcarisporiella thermophila]|uniref:uncharacterized protein n=1 Tax=Calcarisporiella thermophila TaxID=911321 RepID=UPI003742E62B
MNKRALPDIPSPLSSKKPKSLEDVPPTTLSSIASSGEDLPVHFPRTLYLDLFVEILDTVLASESKLFLINELTLFDSFRSLSRPSQILFVRLFLRKRDAWFRVRELKYTDVGDVNEACRELEGVGFVRNMTGICAVEEALTICSVDELKEVAKEVCGLKAKVNSKNRKSLLEMIQKSSTQATLATEFRLTKPHSRREQVIAKITEKTGYCIQLDRTVVEIFHRLHLVYYRSSGHDEKRMTTSILARIEKRNYPMYKTERTQVFPSREAVVEYESALKLQSEIDQLLEGQVVEEAGMARVMQVLDEIVPLWEVLVVNWEEAEGRSYFLRRYSAVAVYTRIIEKCANILGKMKMFKLEEELLRKLLGQYLFRQGKRGEWYDRLALVLARYSEDPKQGKKQALETCLEALVDSGVGVAHLSSIQRRIMRLERELKIPKRDQHDFTHLALRQAQEKIIYGERVSDSITGQKSLWRAKDGDEVSVEELALGYYRSLGYKGYHCENGIITTLFALLFWDILFMPVSGVFETSFQSAPLDFGTDAFYSTRCVEINRRISQISSGDFLGLLREADERERPRATLCIGLSWEYEQWELEEVSQCIGGPALAQVCRLLAQEYRSSGLPDLCLWNSDMNKAKMVEVKGPGDRLSEKQKNWIDVLLGAELEVEVCYVRVLKEEHLL